MKKLNLLLSILVTLVLLFTMTAFAIDLSGNTAQEPVSVKICL